MKEQLQVITNTKKPGTELFLFGETKKKYQLSILGLLVKQLAVALKNYTNGQKKTVD